MTQKPNPNGECGECGERLNGDCLALP